MTRRPWALASAALIVLLLHPASAVGARACFGRSPTISVGGDGDYVVYGTPGDDVITAEDGNDRIYAGRGDDVVCGGRGNDRIRGGKGADRISGGRANDVPFRSNQKKDVLGGLLGNAGPDVIRGGEGIDLLKGGRGGDVLRGGPDWDNDLGVSGISSASSPSAAQRTEPAGGGEYHASWGGKIFGGAGDDRLFGGSGNDQVDARDGVKRNDFLNGGGGANFCRSDPDRERNCPRPQ